MPSFALVTPDDAVLLPTSLDARACPPFKLTLSPQVVLAYSSATM